MALTYTKTWADGDTLSHTHLNANFQDVATYLDTTKLALASLQKPYSYVTFGQQYSGTVASGASRTLEQCILAHAWEPVSFSVSFRAVSSGTPTISLTVTDDASNILTTPLTTSTADTPVASTGFTISNVASGSVLKAVVAVSGGDVSDILVRLTGKAYHVA